MKRLPVVEIAHRALHDSEKGFIKYLLNQVNLTLLEKELITRSEINGEKIETICLSLKNWGRKNDCSYSNGAKIKRTGMIEIGEYLQNKSLFIVNIKYKFSLFFN
jgi:hypothetical protein